MEDMRSARKALGYSQTQLAAALGVQQSTISKLESGALPIDERTKLAVEALLMRAASGEQAAA